jgi:ribonuclease P protein component
MNEKLPKSLILRNSEDFKKILSTGRVFHGKQVTIYYELTSETKVGFAVSKKMGKANKRNLFKRWLREIYRKNKTCFISLSIVFLVKQKSRKDEFKPTYKEILKDVQDFVQKLK